MQIITIMADFGGAYAWLRNEADQHAGVGGAIDFEFLGFPVSAELASDARRWTAGFEVAHIKALPIDWPRFHAAGIELARRLKAESHDRVCVRYVKAWEDAQGRRDPVLEVLADGSLRELPSHRPARCAE